MLEESFFLEFVITAIFGDFTTLLRYNMSQRAPLEEINYFWCRLEEYHKDLFDCHVTAQSTASPSRYQTRWIPPQKRF